MYERTRVMELFEQKKEFWKKRVDTDIEKYRKGLGEITVKDENGNSIGNAKIKLVQKTHEFKFGANIFMLDQFETKEKNELYKKYFTDVFNMATLPFYWNATEPKEGETRYTKESVKMYRRPAIDLCVEFCEKHGIEPREHALAYEHFFPDWLSDKSVSEVKEALEKRYKEISERYKDKIRTIEVTNEMGWAKEKTAFYNDPDFIKWCFKMAEKYFPSNQLVINEWAGLWKDGLRGADNKYYSYIEANMLKGARVDAIGMQYHMFHRLEDEYEKTRAYYDPERLYKIMDLYSYFKKPLQVTELTIPAYSNNEEDEIIQAQIIEILYSIWFSHPNMEQIIYWNLVDGYAHVAVQDAKKISETQGDMTVGENYYYGGLIRFDMTPKKSYYTIKNLIKNKWHTEADIVTNDDGKTSFKGFYGNYDVEITANGKTINKTINLSSKETRSFIFEI